MRGLDVDLDAFSYAGAGFGRKAKTAKKAQLGEADTKSGVLKATKKPKDEKVPKRPQTCYFCSRRRSARRSRRRTPS